MPPATWVGVCVCVLVGGGGGGGGGVVEIHMLHKAASESETSASACLIMPSTPFPPLARDMNLIAMEAPDSAPSNLTAFQTKATLA